MRRKIYLFASLVAFTVPALGFAADNPDFQEGQTTVQEMRGYFEGRKEEYRQYLADLEAYNQAIIAQQEWDNNRINEDRRQQQTQDEMQDDINRQSNECPQQATCQQGIMNLVTQANLLSQTCPQKPTEQERLSCQQTADSLHAQAYQQSMGCPYTSEYQSLQACQQGVAEGPARMQDQAGEYAAYRQSQEGTRPVVGPRPTFHDNTAELDKAYVFNENQVLEEKVNVVGERNMTDEQGGEINTEQDVRNYYDRNYTAGSVGITTYNDVNASLNARRIIDAQIEAEHPQQ